MAKVARYPFSSYAAPVLAAAKHEADPFESQGSHRSMAILITLALLQVIGTGPNRLRNRLSRLFVKTPPQKLGTRAAKMYPFLPTPLRHWGDPAVRSVPLPHWHNDRVVPGAANKRGANAAPIPGSDSKMEKPGTGVRRLRNLALQGRDTFQQDAQHSCDHLSFRPAEPAFFSSTRMALRGLVVSMFSI